MSLLQNSNAISTGGAYNLESSLRFRDSASSYLSRTPTTVGNRKTWTWSGWVKRGALDVGAQQLFSSNSGSAPWFGLWLVAANNLEVSFGSGATAGT